MTTTEAEPWSVPVRLDALGRRLDRTLVADEIERARIAQALGIEALNALAAEVTVTQTGAGGEVKGRLQAQVVQICGVSLEPFETAIATDFAASFTTQPLPEPEPDDAETREFSLADLDAPDVIDTGVLDLGRYVVEHLALELDPFPRKPGAEFEAPAAETEPSPFAVLAALKPPGKAGA